MAVRVTILEYLKRRHILKFLGQIIFPLTEYGLSFCLIFYFIIFFKYINEGKLNKMSPQSSLFGYH